MRETRRTVGWVLLATAVVAGAVGVAGASTTSSSLTGRSVTSATAPADDRSATATSGRTPAEPSAPRAVAADRTETSRASKGDAAAPARIATRRSTGRPPCTDHEAEGGEWPGLNGDLHNTRSQPAERTIGVDQAPALQPAWAFSADTVGASGGMRTTPIVAGGCVYLAFGQGYLGDRGDVVALDADTGALVWHAPIDGSVLGLAVSDGLVYVTPSRGTRGDVPLPVVNDAYQPAGSYALALDASTGTVRWQSEHLDDGTPGNGTFITASPVVFEAGGRRMVFVPLAGGAGDGARVPMYFLDARSGQTIAKAFTIPEADYQAGFGGTGIWATAAFDADTGHLYVGTADSDGRTRQHRYNNALLRIDADPRRSTFASVVGWYAGTSEHANLDPLIGYPNNPLCGALGESAGVELPTFFDTSASPECLELDLDFGASPNLSRAADGKLVLTALQKSGVFHAVDAATMAGRWSFFVGPGGAAMDSATAAVSAGTVHVGATPNLVFGLGRDDGALGWASTTDLDLFAYQPLTVANGVLYGINDSGHLLGLDAATGRPLLRRAITTDGPFSNCLGVGAGVAVARNTVFAPCDAGGTVDLAGVQTAAGGVVAYRPAG